MNCSSCGTQIPQGAPHCPQCGVATPYTYSQSRVNPDDPTVVTLFENGAQQTQSTSSGSTTTYQISAEPSHVIQTSPQFQRGRRRFGIIVAVVVLVVLVIGGGALAWIVYSASGKFTNATSQHFTAQGNGKMVDDTATHTQQNGSDQIANLTQHWISSGDIAGAFTVDEVETIHSDKTASFTGKITCTCTVSGKSGALLWSVNGTQRADGNFQGQFSDLQGTGDLAKLHGQGTFQGQDTHFAYTADLHFDS